MWGIWLIIAGICFIIEIATVGFLIFWFGIGALLAMLISFLFPANLFLQTAVFVLTSTLLIFFTKPFVEKFTKNDQKVATNAYSIIGKKAIVTHAIDPTQGLGQIKVSGELWSAKTIDGSTIDEQTQVQIIQIEGVKAIVEPLEKQSQKTKATTNSF